MSHSEGFSWSIHSLKKPFMLRRFYRNITGSVGITSYWSDTSFIIFLKKNIVLKYSFKLSYSSNILASFPEIWCQGADTFGFIRVNFWNLHSRRFLHILCTDTSLKSRRAVDFGD